MAAKWEDENESEYERLFGADDLAEGLDRLFRAVIQQGPKPKRSRKERLLMASVTTGPKGALAFINRCFERSVNGCKE